jgi:CubicO group peptidase (beta-lactamase class C family)
MGRVLTFAVVLVGLTGLATAGMQVPRTGSGGQAPARVAPALPTSDEAPTSLRAALADSAVQSSLARHVRRLRVDAASLEPYAPAEYDLRNVQSDATLPAPDRITPAEIQGLTRARAPRPAPNVQVLTPPAGRLPAFTPAPSPRRGLTTAPTPSLDVNAFGQQLHNALSPNVTGYVMRLRRGGETIYTLQWNWAQTTADGSLGWSPSRRMHIASISKLITAIAMTRALDEAGLSYDARIAAHLPAYWSRGANVGEITFRHLMRHESGIVTDTSSGSFAFARQRIAAGVPASGIGASDYENVNFSLQRILIATVAGYIDPAADFSLLGNDTMWNALTNAAYVDYVQRHVFGPAGVTGATLTKPASPARAYTFNGTGSGWNSGDLSAMSGGAGWHLSVDEVLNVMGTLVRGNAIMSPIKARGLLDAGFGLDSPVGGVSTPAGRLYHKNGRWRQSNGRTEQSVAFFLPEGMELAVFVNSDIGAGNTFLRTLVQQLYVDNIVTP